jgi:Fe-S-cluster containining protein
MTHLYRKVSFGSKVNFECLMCGQCCSNGPNLGLTAFDILRIANYLGIEWRELRGKYIVTVIADLTAIPILRDKGGGRCVFLENREGKAYCRIYPARPMRCRLYPFIPYSPSDNHTLYLDECCPGIKTDKTIEPPWNTLEKYNFEARIHYSKIYTLTFKKGFEPLEALEKSMEEIAALFSMESAKGKHLRQGSASQEQLYVPAS